MKRMKIAGMLAALAVLVMFTSCGGGGGGGGGKGSGALLTSLRVAGQSAELPLPTAITKAQWDNTEEYPYLSMLEGTGGVVYLPNAAALVNAAVVTEKSSGAKVALGMGDDFGERGTTIDFTKASPITFNEFDWLYIRVISEDGKTTNYYRFQIMLVGGNATLSQLTVSGVSSSLGSGGTAWDSIGSPGVVSLTNAQKTAAAVVATPSETTGTTIKYAVVPAGTDGEPDLATAPVFGDTATFTFNDSDLLYIEVTAPNGESKLYYRVEVWIGRNANLSNITFQVQEVSSLGDGGATLAAAKTGYGYIVFRSKQPAAGFPVHIEAVDEDATITYVVGAKDDVITESEVSTSYTWDGTGGNANNWTPKITFADEDWLYVKVTSANGKVVKYYVIQIGLMQTAEIQAGSPQIKASSEKFIDPVWATATEVYNISKIAPFGDTTADYRDEGKEHPGYTTGVAKALWDFDGIYLYVEVTDPEVATKGSGWTISNAHEEDSFELFVNEAPEDPASVTPVGGGTEAQFSHSSGQYRVGVSGNLSGHAANARTAFQTLNNASVWETDTGYIVIMQAPWLHGTPATDDEIGFELQINACRKDGGSSARDGVMVWNNISFSNYQNNSAYGLAVLKGTPLRHAQYPTITAQPASNLIEPGQTYTLSVAANVTDGGQLTYEWFSAATATGAGTSVGTGETYQVTGGSVGTTYYYVVVTNTNNDAEGEKVRRTTSNRAKIDVMVYVTPADWAEWVVTIGTSAPVYGFNIPGGKTFGDYDRITFEVKDDTSSANHSGRLRAWGPYPAAWTNDVNANSRPSMGNSTGSGGLLLGYYGGNNSSGASTSFANATWTSVDIPFDVLNGDGVTALTDATTIKARTGLVTLAFGYIGGGDAPNANNNTRSYYVRKIKLSNAAGTETIEALYPEHPRLWSGNGSKAYVTQDFNAGQIVTRELISDTIVLAPYNGTLLTDGFSATPTFQTYTYNGKTYWVFATTNSGNTGDPVPPFDAATGADADAFAAIKAIAAAYSRVSIDLSTINAGWRGYSKVTLTYDMIQVGGSSPNVIFRNGTGGGTDPTVNATAGGYATALLTGNGNTVTLPIGEAGENIKPSVGPILSVVKHNDNVHCILLRVSKIELHN